MLTVLVREAAQNSWDARIGERVDFSMHLGTVGPDRAHVWRELLLPGAPRPVGPVRGLGESLRKRSIRYLAVTDRGTTGLGGPTRSDHYAEPGNRGWLSFVLNSGEKQDTDGGGGTYGYGKGAFFLASRVGTILIHTRFRDESGELRTRLIGSALLGEFHDRDRRPFTGRHWWGDVRSDHCEPLVDQVASEYADRLGLPPFEGNSTGTTVVVMDPDLRDASDDGDGPDLSQDEAGEYLADAAAWNLWPLTLVDRDQRLNLSISVNGVAVQVPNESNDAAIACFARAYRKMLEREPGGRIECLKPRRLLGQFAVEQTFGASVRHRAAEELGLERDKAPHHVALMRHPDLVVGYFEGQAKPHPEVGYAGVFKVDDDLDVVFSRAEPPTHDAWVDAQLSGHDATFVRVARRRLSDRCADLVGPRHVPRAVESTPVGGVSQRLGFLLAGGGGAPVDGDQDVVVQPPSRGGDATGAGGGARRSGDGTGRAGARRKPRFVGEPRFEMLDGRWVVAQALRVSSEGRVRGCVAVVTGEGTEASAPVAAGQPTVLGWRRSDGAVVLGDTVDAGNEELDLLACPVEDAALELTVEWDGNLS
ncbi:MAG: hypothetical protein IR158_11785 [Cellulomonas sp.]|uniref:hypothetical protein n=1 Tax=Cellulomonas sp. TaxID=40001 RepID=UPI0019EB86E0|nr:hypothetical protein [Cellulomonas sp.]MBF0688429.1 hypothetical protein [Cellulomonas sp.]